MVNVIRIIGVARGGFMNSLMLYFHLHERVAEYPLPAGNNRRIQLNLGEILPVEACNIQFEVWDQQWHVVSNEGAQFSYGGTAFQDRILRDGDIINGVICSLGLPFTLVVHGLGERLACFDKLAVAGRQKITVGSGAQSDIVICGDLASKSHAVLTRRDQTVYIADHSKNGTYLNNRRLLEETPLELMDVIYVVGVKIVFMGDFLAVNQPDMRRIALPPYQSPAALGEKKRDAPLIRAPRLVEPLDVETVELEAPPAPQRLKPNPLIFIIGPSITMPLPILVSVLVNMNRSAGNGGGMYLGTVVSVGLSALLGGIWALAHHFYNKRTSRREEAHRVCAYQRYLENNDKLLEEKRRHNTRILNSQHLSPQEFTAVLVNNKSILWNRNSNQRDFLAVRLGRGLCPIPGQILAPKQRFSLVEDPLVEEPRKLLQKHSYLQEAVSLVRLADAKIVGVLGDGPALNNAARTIALQVCALHSYTDVKLAFILRPGEEKQFSWAKWLPHVRSADHKQRFICATDAQRKNVLYALAGILRARGESRDESSGAKRWLPHFVVFCTDPALLSGEVISQYMQDGLDYQFTFVLLYGILDSLPNQCTHIIQDDADFTGYYRMDDERAQSDEIHFDRISFLQADYLARKIGEYVVSELASEEIPSNISFFELYGLGRVEQWDLLKRWKENRTYESMRALVGIGTGGKPLYLDIHEKQHGPHGLVAGTTGSGKSETIQTYILSLAMNFHPDEIALILIDYKGGGMANTFAGLPHVAGTITNLDGGQTQRALISIKGEIKRRQALFNQYKVNHIDLYARLFREEKAAEPMPHLIIISDEFAELKKEQPEFIKELVSTARVGRSLGIHLILATQKPSGVVDDEIWSNSRFKLCLRVQDKQDSNEMLKRPDAAFLTITGRAFLQIGNDELFEQFQSGYSGADYEPSEELLSAEDTEVTMVGLDGTPLVVKAKKQSKDAHAITQLDACVQYIGQVARGHGIGTVRPLWLPELQAGVTLAQILSGYPRGEAGGLQCVYGLIDNPAIQAQSPASVDILSCGNLLIAGIPGCGKSTMLQTMLYSLATQYPPESVNFYCMDFSSTLLRVFEGLPHCGGVLKPDDNERIPRLFLLLRNQMEQRRQLFEKAAVSGFEEYRRLDAEPLPAIALVLDNYYLFLENYPHLEEEFEAVLRQGNKYGIYLLVAVNHLNDIKYKLRQNFSTILPLALAERTDYMEALGGMPHYVPTQYKGRGLNADMLEFQVAFAAAGDNERDRADCMRREFEGLGLYQASLRAEEIRYIQKDMVYADFLSTPQVRGETAEDCICIGYRQQDISIAKIMLPTTYCYAVGAASSKGVVNFMLNLVEAGRRIKARQHMVCLRHNALADEDLEGVYRTGEDIYYLLIKMKEEFSQRSGARKQFIKDNPSKDSFGYMNSRFDKIFVVIDSMNDYCDVVYAKQVEDYSAIMELFIKQGAGLGIYFFAGFEQAVYTSGNFFKPLCKSFLEHGGAIHLGGKLDQQKLFPVQMSMSEQMKPREYTTGYIVEEDEVRVIFIPPNTPA